MSKETSGELKLRLRQLYFSEEEILMLLTKNIFSEEETRELVKAIFTISDSIVRIKSLLKETGK